MVRRSAALGFTDVVVGWPRRHGLFQAEQSTFERFGSWLGPDGDLAV
jgi:hypothetical protein